MSTLQQVKEGLSEAWDTFTEGWQRLYRHAAGAITRFTPGKGRDGDAHEVVTRSAARVARRADAERQAGPGPAAADARQRRAARRVPAVARLPETLPTADIPVPMEHPLVRQAMEDCLHEVLDLDGCTDVLRGLRSGEITGRVIDTAEPSPLSHEILNAKPYAFLDDAPLEERRTRAVMTRRTLDRSNGTMSARWMKRRSSG